MTTFPGRIDRSRVASAFTLLEFMIVITIIGTLALIAVPRYASFLAEQRIEAAARRVGADLAYAQRSARMTSSSLTVRFNVSAESYTLVGLADPDHAGVDYSVILSREPYRTAITSINLGGDTDIIFNGYGVPDSGGSVNLRLGNATRTVSIHPQTGQVTITRVIEVVPVPEELPKQPPVLEI